MPSEWMLAAGSAAVFVALGYALHRAYRDLAQLRGRLQSATAELQRLQLSFSRFAPREIVERVVTSGIPISGEKKEVTVLFADLVEFSALSEQLDPAVVVRVLNGYFARMSRAITAHRGHVAKFIGDGMLALFGALEPNPWQGDDAVHATLAMQAALEEYNRALVAEELPPLRFGAGIHRGPVIAGIVGSDELIEFTAIGRNVNLAARVERLTRQHAANVLVTRGVQATLDSRFVLREIPPTDVKGFSEPVVTFAVEGFRE
jgi:adenylate cyclase